MSDQNQRGASSSNIIFNNPTSSNMDLFNYNPGVIIQTHHYPIQQPVTVPLQAAQAQRFNPMNSQVPASSQRQPENAIQVQVHSLAEARSEVSAICQNVSASLQELENRNENLTNTLEQEKEANGLLSRKNKRLSAELEKGRLEISSLKSTAAASEATISQLQQEIITTNWVNTTLKAEANAKTTQAMTTSNDLSIALQQNQMLQSINTKLQNDILVKSGEICNLEKEVKGLKKYAKGKACDLEGVQDQLEFANREIRDLNRENMRLSAKLDTILNEERQRQTLYKNSCLAQLMREKEEKEREPEGSRKRSASEADGEISKKKRNGDISSTASAGQQADEEEEVGINSQVSTRSPDLQDSEMLESVSGSGFVEITYQWNTTN